jgi:hypothetical protein
MDGARVIGAGVVWVVDTDPNPAIPAVGFEVVGAVVFVERLFMASKQLSISKAAFILYCASLETKLRVRH